MVTATISKLDLYANDKVNVLMNYILQQLGDQLAKELVEKYRDEVYELITPDKILIMIGEKIKESIKIGDSKK